MKSYSGQSKGPLDLVRESVHLVRGRSQHVPRQLASDLERVQGVETLITERLGINLDGLTMLDVGAGQLLVQMAYFSRRNTVVGIDKDVIVRGLDLRGYARMLRRNGSIRVIKTLGRKALLVDARYRRELMKQLDLSRLPRLEVTEMDAARMTFPDGSFEAVYSMAVFQHLESPAAVIDEMARVLKPGGVLYFDFILHTGPTGSHDVRFLASDENALPPWAHLRPRFESLVQPNAYLNRLRLPAWRELIEARLPGYNMVLVPSEGDQLSATADALRTDELKHYTREELMTSKVIVLWRKPSSARHGPGSGDELADRDEVDT